MRVVAIPGTLCSPAIFDRLAELVPLDAVSWMTEPGPWDIGTLAHRIAEGLTEPVTVVGHSTGGAIALRLALDHPGLVAGLLIVDSGAHMRGHGDVDRHLATMPSTWGPRLHAALLDRSFATPLEPAMRQALLDYAATVPLRAALEVLSSQRDLDLTPRLAELACPVTVVHGRLDPVRSTDQARELAEAIPGARLTLLDTGHTPVYEAPEAVAAELRALLARSGS
jgi:3-oxoadipate enol-lactonase